MTRYLIMAVGVILGTMLAVGILASFQLFAQFGAESLFPFRSRAHSANVLKSCEFYFGSLRIALSFGSIFYSPFTSRLILAKNELMLAPSVFVVSLILPTWNMPLENISIFENTGDGLRLYTDPNSGAFTFITSRYLEILQALREKFVAVQWNVVQSSLRTGKRR
ncbi:MAG: hypothetical protein HKL80_06105 [Acidimicrobiales bacterium]|nr:hypothetical protein [Acidimicrobiales bacterium]